MCDPYTMAFTAFIYLLAAVVIFMAICIAGIVYYDRQTDKLKEKCYAKSK